MAPTAIPTDAVPLVEASPIEGLWRADPVFLITAATLLPVLTYPFLPDNTVAARPPFDSYLGLSMAQLVFFHLPNYFRWITGYSYYDVAFWVAPLATCLFISGISADDAYDNARTKHCQVTQRDFKELTGVIAGILGYIFVRLGLSYGINPFAGDGVVSLVEVLYMWVLATLIGFVGVRYGHQLFEVLVEAHYQFVTRRVKWWTWLPQNQRSIRQQKEQQKGDGSGAECQVGLGGDNTEQTPVQWFDPVWGKGFMALVCTSTPVFLAYILYMSCTGQGGAVKKPGWF